MRTQKQLRNLSSPVHTLVTIFFGLPATKFNSTLESKKNVKITLFFQPEHLKTQRNKVLFFWLLEQWLLEYGCPHLSQVPLFFCTSTCVKQLHVFCLTLSIWWGCQSVACFPLKEESWALNISGSESVCFSNPTICMSSQCFYSLLQKFNLQKGSPSKSYSISLFVSLFSYLSLSVPQGPGSGLLVHQGAVIALNSLSKVSTEAPCTQELCLSPATSPGLCSTYIVDTPLISPVTYQCCPGFLAWPCTLLVTWDFLGEDLAPACTVDTLSSSLPSLGELPALAGPWQGCWKWFTYGWIICKEQGLINNFDLLNMDCHIHSYF